MSDRMAAILDRSQPRSHGARPEDGVPNMTVISDIDENGININLKTRYQKDKIYTFTGSILVSVNPYKEIKIYEQENVTQYSKKKISQVEPHIFAIAEAAIQNLQETDINQSCIISGESGAGKTESTKFILQYLCSVTNHTSFWTEQQILEANTVLEAFGNAKTVRNDNSSRFGKFMQVCFDQHCQIKGCIVQDYLLEQSRITFQSLNERNYHVFYQLVAGAQASSEVAQQFQLCPPQSYAYLNQSGCFTLPGVDDSTMFDNLRLAMNVLNIPTKMVNGIFSVLSAILLLGNLSFEDDEGEKTVLTETDNNILTAVCNLLGFEMDGLRDAALYRQIQVRGTVTSIPFKFQEAIENRHAMAKALYSRTFAWLVDAINKCTNPGSSQTHFIGILDIFGFENFQTNSFEQLCINYTNEKLHRFFNHYVFALEQEKYREEDIEFSHITFTDNSKCVELIEKAPRCVMKILDEECRFPKGTDKTYLNKQHQELDDHEHYMKGQDRRVWEQEFGIRHYAGIVIYNATGFLDKNKDTQQDQLFELMHNSNSEFVKDLTRFQDLLGVRLEILDGRQTISRTARNKPTVGDTFKHQLSALVDVLALTNPWYVRCLKPNAMKKANEFVDDDVLTQLRYSGMLDIIRIKREGYPVHMNVSTFLQKYGLLIGTSPLHLEEGDPRSYVKTILEELKLQKTECQIGITKVFMRNSVLEPLEDLRFQFLTIKVICIQKHWRGFWLRKGFLEKKHAVLILQFNFRCFRSRLAFLRKRKAAVTIQSYMRGVLARHTAQMLREEKRLEEKRRREEEQQLLRVQKVQADECSIQKTIRESQVELESLTTLIESMWTHHQPAVTPHSLDLDSMFEFLQEEKAERKAAAVDKEEALHEINEEFDVLGSLLTDAEESSEKLLHDHEIQQALAEVDKSIAEFDDSRSPHEKKDYVLRDDRNELPPLPPPPPTLPCTNEETASFTCPSVCMPPPPSIPPPPAPPLPPPSISEDHRLQQLPAPPQSCYQTDELLLAQTDGNESGWKTDIDGSSVYQEIGHGDSGQLSLSNPPPPPPPPPPRRGSTLTSVSPTHETEEMTLSFQMNFTEYESHGNEVTELSPDTEEKLSQLMEQHSVDTSSPQTTDTLDKHNSSAEIDTIHDILEFAGKYFNSHIKDSGGTLMKSLKKRRQSDADRLTKGEMLTFCKSGLIPTSLVHLHDCENVTMACNVFKELTKVMRDEMTDDSSMQIMQMIVKIGIERIALRDEIFCQLIKQTNGNPEADSLVIAWIIFCLCTAAFSPSKSLHKYLLSYVKMNCSDALVGKYALMCHKHLTVPRVSSRKLPPSAIEIMSVRALSPIICKVYFMDGKTKAVTVLPCDTSTELLERLAEKIGLGSVEGWAIYEVTGDTERFVRRYEYVSDILAQWEHLDRLSAQPSKYETVNKKGPKLALGGSDAKLVFKKRVYRHVHDIPNDPVEYHLLYAEAVNKVVKLDEFSVSEKVALQLAGLQAQVIWGEYEEDKPFRYSEAEQYLTGRILASSGRNWSMEVSRAHKHFGSGKTELAAKVWYLTCVKQFPLYGCTLFPIVHRGLWSHTSDALLAVNMDGIKFVRAKDKSVITDFFFSDIESVSMDPNDNYITLELKNQIQTESPQQTYMFETSFKEDVGLLIASYSPSHASWIRMDFESMKKIKMTDEEKLKVYEEIVRCRRALSESRLLQRPLQDSSSSFLRNTLRRLTKTKLERLRTYATSSSESGQFNVNYWSYSKSPLRQALTVIHDPSVEEVAVKMFNSILVYAGIEDSSAGDSHDNTGMIQNLMLKCLENDHLCNEFYMQLIKQTTDHPDPNSQVNGRCWQLMCVAAGVMAPANTRVLKYLQVHLKKCSLDTTTEEGKFARFCFKTLSRTTDAKRRTFPPSKQEINCTIQRRPITEHIYFLNGEHRIIEFDSAAVCGELTKMVKVKIGMRSDAEGFAMYEVMSGSERCMAVDERLSDTLSKWERLSRSGAVKDLKLIFKKRLFIKPYINSGDPVECDLVFHQLLEDVFEKRKPISTQDAIHLCALKVQSEIEDMRSGEIDYSSVVRILPRDLRMTIRLEDISTTHKTVLDMSPQNAVLSFIQVLMAWQLFGATVFEVGQTYTSALPKTLLLAVDKDGIHLLESKTFRELAAYSYSEIVHSSPAIKSIMIVIGHVAKGTKFMFNTNQASQIAHLMKDYVDELQVQGLLLPTEGTQRMSRLVDIDEFERQRNSSQNTVILAQRQE